MSIIRLLVQTWIPFLFTGYLMGSEDYYSHVHCYYSPDEKKTFCGLDLRDGEEVATEYKGDYSTEVFTQKALSIIDKQDPDKVTRILHTLKKFGDQGSKGRFVAALVN